MALVDRALRARELGEELTAPAQDEEFVLSHSDNVQATGFVEHLKLPHYVDFQAELLLVRQLRAEHEARTPPRVETREAAPNDRRARLQLRLSRRADQADDPPRHPQGGGDPRLPGAVRQPRDADALWLGHRRHPGDRGGHRPRRRAQGHRPGRRRHHQRRLDPRLLRQGRPASPPRRRRTRRRSSRPATASRRRRSTRARSSSIRCRSPSRCASSSRARPRPGRCTRSRNTA